MVSLPTVGGDNNTWGQILNTFLNTSLNANGSLNPFAVVGAIPTGTYALNNSPAFSGIPTAPTNPNVTDGSNQIATNAFVQAAAIPTVVALGNMGAGPSVALTANTTYITGTLTANCNMTLGNLTKACSIVLLLTQNGTGGFTFAIDSVAVTVPLGANAIAVILGYSPDGENLYALPVPQEALGAPLNSPAFTGIPTAPTASGGTNTTQLATTQFVQTAVVDSTTGVASFNTRTGAVVPTSGDYSVAQVTGAAPLASPTFTGTPNVPTASGGTSNGQAASTGFVALAVAVAQLTPANVQTANYTAQASDVNGVIQMNSSSATTVTIPSGTFSAGQTLEVCAEGTGAVSLAGSGVTLNSFGGALILAGQNASATIRFTSATVAYVAGNVVA